MELLDKVHEKYRKLTEYLIKNNISISTMESCTSGLIASLITDTEGSSAILKGAFITYSNEAKVLNKVPLDIIDKYGVYSNETSLHMARSCKMTYKSDIGIGITGTLGNVDPNNKDSIPGNVYITCIVDNDEQNYQLELNSSCERFEAKLLIADYLCDRLFDLFND